jgi:Tol biopolymer transport system component
MVASRNRAAGLDKWLKTSPWRRALSAVMVLLGLGLLSCQSVPSASDGKIASSEMAEVSSVDRITYVSAGGDLFTVKADGSEQQRLTGGGTQLRSGSTGPFLAQSIGSENFYAWPTWSPDGAKLAASRVQVSSGQNVEITIQVIDVATVRSNTVYSNDFPGLVAEGSPHYLYWSPDSKFLSFLASTAGRLTLFVMDTESNSEPVAVESGAPLYYSWAGDSNSLLIHIGPEVKLVRELSGGSSGQVLATARGFRVPAFSRDGSQIAYIGQAGPEEALFVAETGNVDSARQVMELGAFSAFMWSPDGTQLAVADQEDPNSIIFERLRIISADGSSVRTVAEGPMLAFYWSPNGERIAWVALNQEDQTFEWKVAASVSNGPEQARSLFSFHPSRDVLTMLSFFDQYAYSHSPWSPDSSRLVVAGTQAMPFERRNGQTPTGARVFVLDAEGNTPPQEIAEGTLAFWSWN